MTPPRGVVLIALAMLGTAGCAGTPSRLGLSWPYQRPTVAENGADPTRRLPSREPTPRETSNQRTPSPSVTTNVPSLNNQSLEPVNVWPAPNSEWLTHPLSTISKLWIGTAGRARTTRSDVDPSIRASSDTAWVPPQPKASSVTRSARADNDVQPAEANAADERKAKNIDRGVDEIAPNATSRTAKLQIAVSRSRNARVSGTADAHDDPSSTAPADTNAKLRARQLFEDAATSVGDREESLLPPGSLSASELQFPSTQQAPGSVAEPMTETNGAARNALQPKTAREDDVAPTSPTTRRVAVQSSTIAPDVDSGWACEGDSRAPSVSTEAMHAEKPASETDKKSTCSSPLQSSIGLEATDSKPEAPPARSESEPAPLSSTSRETPTSTMTPRSSPTSGFAPPQSAPITPVTPLPTTLDERSLMPASLSPASSLRRTPRPPSDWLAEDQTALSQSPAAASSTKIVPVSSPAKSVQITINPAPPTTRATPTSQKTVPQVNYASPPPAARSRTHGWLRNWLFKSSNTEPIVSSALPPPTFPASYRSDRRQDQEIQASPQKDRSEDAPTPYSTKKQCTVLSWLHKFKTPGSRTACGQNHCCEESGRCSCCTCCLGIKSASASPSAPPSPTAQAPSPAAIAPKSSGP
jgi:hypothetical protein